MPSIMITTSCGYQISKRVMSLCDIEKIKKYVVLKGYGVDDDSQINEIYIFTFLFLRYIELFNEKDPNKIRNFKNKIANDLIKSIDVLLDVMACLVADYENKGEFYFFNEKNRKKYTEYTTEEAFNELCASLISQDEIKDYFPHYRNPDWLVAYYIFKGRTSGANYQNIRNLVWEIINNREDKEIDNAKTISLINGAKDTFNLSDIMGKNIDSLATFVKDNAKYLGIAHNGMYEFLQAAKEYAIEKVSPKGDCGDKVSQFFMEYLKNSYQSESAECNIYFKKKTDSIIYLVKFSEAVRNKELLDLDEKVINSIKIREENVFEYYDFEKKYKDDNSFTMRFKEKSYKNINVILKNCIEARQINGVNEKELAHKNKLSNLENLTKDQALLIYGVVLQDCFYDSNLCEDNPQIKVLLGLDKGETLNRELILKLLTKDKVNNFLNGLCMVDLSEDDIEYVWVKSKRAEFEDEATH